MRMKTRSFTPRAGLQAQCAAVTRTEVVVTLFVAVCLAGLLLWDSARAFRGPGPREVRCLNNLKQVMDALSLYTQDNQDLFPPNPDDGNMLPGYNWCPGDAGMGGEQFNPDILADGRYCLVAPYLRSNVQVFHCTADSRTAVASHPLLQRQQRCAWRPRLDILTFSVTIAL
jgi:hypothetical protein